MQEIGDRLRSRGHRCNILVTDERVDADGETIPAAVTMEFYPAGMARRRFTKTNTPHVSFIARPGTRKILIHENSATPRIGGWFGSKGEFSLEDIDGDFVQKQIVLMVREVLSNLGR
jgi:hypothetical protein